MASVSVNFDTDNAAFRMEDEDLCEAAVADVLRQVAERIVNGDYHPGHTQTIRDENGNRVGGFKVSE